MSFRFVRVFSISDATFKSSRCQCTFTSESEELKKNYKQPIFVVSGSISRWQLKENVEKC